MLGATGQPGGRSEAGGAGQGVRRAAVPVASLFGQPFNPAACTRHPRRTSQPAQPPAPDAGAGAAPAASAVSGGPRSSSSTAAFSWVPHLDAPLAHGGHDGGAGGPSAAPCSPPCTMQEAPLYKQWPTPRGASAYCDLDMDMDMEVEVDADPGEDEQLEGEEAAQPPGHGGAGAPDVPAGMCTPRASRGGAPQSPSHAMPANEAVAMEVVTPSASRPQPPAPAGVVPSRQAWQPPPPRPVQAPALGAGEAAGSAGTGNAGAAAGADVGVALPFGPECDMGYWDGPADVMEASWGLQPASQRAPCHTPWGHVPHLHLHAMAGLRR